MCVHPTRTYRSNFNSGVPNSKIHSACLLGLAILTSVFWMRSGSAHETGRDNLARHLRHNHHAIEWSGHTTIESISNLLGGIRTGTTGAAAIMGGFALNTYKAGGWAGGAFQVQVMGLERWLPRESHLVGDAQGVSNLYNSFSFLRLIALVYRQRIGRAHARIRLVR